MAIKALQEKVDKAYPLGTKNRDESDYFLKALSGLTRLLEVPNVDQFLKGLDRYPTTTLGHLVTFMHSFGLRFGAAKTPIQQATYDQLYPILVGLRDASNAQGPNPITAQVPQPDPKALTNFFSGMARSHFQPQPKPDHDAVPPPPQPRSRPDGGPLHPSPVCDRAGLFARLTVVTQVIPTSRLESMPA